MDMVQPFYFFVAFRVLGSVRIRVKRYFYEKNTSLIKELAKRKGIGYMGGELWSRNTSKQDFFTKIGDLSQLNMQMGVHGNYLQI